MEDCTKSTKRIAGNVEEKTEEEQEAAEASNASLLSNETKLINSEEVKELKLPLLENDHSPVVSSHKTTTTAVASDSVSVSDDFSTPRIKSADLKDTRFETEVLTSNNKFSKEETSLLIEICGDSKKDQTSMDAPSKRNPSEEDEQEKIPTAAEIDEFFAAAEQQEQESFIEKYNYDIVKDAPLEGRYQWIRLN